MPPDECASKSEISQSMFSSVIGHLGKLLDRLPNPGVKKTELSAEAWNCHSLILQLREVTSLFYLNLSNLRDEMRQQLAMDGWDGEVTGPQSLQIRSQLEQHQSTGEALFKLIYLLGKQLLNSTHKIMECSHKVERIPATTLQYSEQFLKDEAWLDAQFNFIFDHFVILKPCGMPSDANCNAFLSFEGTSNGKQLAESIQLPELLVRKLHDTPVRFAGRSPRYEEALRSINVYEFCDEQLQLQIKNLLPEIGCETPTVCVLITRLLEWLSAVLTYWRRLSRRIYKTGSVRAPRDGDLLKFARLTRFDAYSAAQYAFSRSISACLYLSFSSRSSTCLGCSKSSQASHWV